MIEVHRPISFVLLKKQERYEWRSVFCPALSQGAHVAYDKGKNIF